MRTCSGEVKQQMRKSVDCAVNKYSGFDRNVSTIELGKTRRWLHKIWGFVRIETNSMEIELSVFWRRQAAINSRSV